MTPEAQRIAIAESRGHTRVWDQAFRQWVQRSPDDKDVVCDPDPDAGWEDSRLPDYLSDLNAMHAAAKAECEKRRWTYAVHWMLGRYICCIYARPTEENVTLIAHVANPDQPAALAEAYLRAINQWTE